MKKIHNYIMLLVMAFTVASCTDEEFIENNKPIGKVGEEVKFSLSFNEGSRTVYGAETEGAFPIYWVPGDKVTVHSPDASFDNNQSDYNVILPEGVTQRDYAENLEKTGEHGVQWGEGYTYKDDNGDEHSGLHDFYSIYPSGNYEFSEVNDDMIAAGVRILPAQEINFIDNKFKHEMSNCLLYANSQKVKMTDGVVNLSYFPLSTVLWFEMNVGSQSEIDEKERHFTIQAVELASETQNISGTFKYNLSKGKFASWLDDEGKKSIAVTFTDKTGDQDVAYTLKENSKIDFPIFLAPDPVLKLSDLKITVYTDKGKFVKTLSKENVDLNDLKLEPGKIHKVKLPELKKTSDKWDVSTWMKFIPRNIYLSEISIPGTWNSLNPEFQANTSIADQYNAGVRAFHFDTRWKRSGNFITGYKYSLGVANGNSTGSSESKYCASTSPLFSDEFNNIISRVQEDEYMILVCSFAQGSAQHDGVNGWIKVISELCENEKVFDARNLDSNTLVGHVLGKVIVIVNTETEITGSTLPESVLATDSKCFFNYTPSEVPQNRFVLSNEPNAETILLSNNSDVYWNTNASETFKSDIKVYSSQAQITSNTENGISTTNGRGYAPTITERLKVLNLIVDWSKSNYILTDYAHDQWIYLGLGGYRTGSSDASTVSGSHAVLENILNPWVNNRILEMKGTDDYPYYPVGIVLMNNKKGGNYTDDSKDLNYGFSDVVTNILMLNNKYRLKRNEDAPKHTDASYSDPHSYKPIDSGGNEGGDAI